MPVNDAPITIQCNSCDRNVGVREFYKYGGEFQELTTSGYYPVCKKCLKNGFEKIRPRDYDEQKKYLLMLCQTMNKPFYSYMFEDIKTTDKNPFREFMSLASNTRHSNKGFLDSDGIRGGKEEKEIKKLPADKKEKWDNYTGFQDGELFRAEELYQSIKKEYSITDNADNSSDLCNLCILKIRVAKEAATGEPKNIKQLNDSIKAISTTLGITSAKSELAGGAKSFGALIETLENEDPSFEIQDRYKDVDALLMTAKTVLGSTHVAFGKASKEKFRKAYLSKYEI